MFKLLYMVYHLVVDSLRLDNDHVFTPTVVNLYVTIVNDGDTRSPDDRISRVSTSHGFETMVLIPGIDPESQLTLPVEIPLSSDCPDLITITVQLGTSSKQIYLYTSPMASGLNLFLIAGAIIVTGLVGFHFISKNVKR